MKVNGKYVLKAFQNVFTIYLDVFCQTLMTNLSIVANSVDPEQTAPIEAV